MRRRLSRWLVMGLPWLALGSFFTIFLVDAKLTIDAWGAFRYSLRCSLPALAAYWLLSWRFFGRHVGAWDSDWLVSAIGASLCFPVGCLAIILWLNSGLDRSPALERRVLVVRKYEAGYRFTNDEASIPYSLVTDSWRSNFPELEFRSYYEGDYLGVVPGKTRLLVKTRRGRFGLEWVESFTLDRTPR